MFGRKRKKLKQIAGIAAAGAEEIQQMRDHPEHPSWKALKTFWQSAPAEFLAVGSVQGPPCEARTWLAKLSLAGRDIPATERATRNAWDEMREKGISPENNMGLEFYEFSDGSLLQCQGGWAGGAYLDVAQYNRVLDWMWNSALNSLEQTKEGEAS